MKRISLTILSICLLVFSFFLPVSQVTANETHGNKVAVGKDGMVATAHPLASEVGADVLKKGGNAVDAAVAIQYALNVTEPMMSGIGGGGFMMVYDGKTKETSIINSRERAPQGATPDMFLTDEGEVIPFAERSTHGNAVGVPGTVKGLEAALDKWGTRSMKELIKPSIQLAEDGFEIDSVLAKAIDDHQGKLKNTAAAPIFLPDDQPLKEGDLLVQPGLAKTFKLIAKKGSKAFYEGKVAKALANTVQDFGGTMTTDDIDRYEVKTDKPIWGDYKGYQLASMPPPSSGGVFMLQMLKILDHFNLSQYDPKSFEKYQLLAETMHLSYADRAAYAGDPEFVDVPLKGLLDDDYISERASLIELDQMNRNPKEGDPWAYEDEKTPSPIVPQPEDKTIGETTHFTVADQWGNVVSFTTTIEQLFGTGILVPEYGFFLNNELTDFDARPGGANEVQPNKRPLSSMTPTIIFKDNEPVMTVGSPGGTTIIASVSQTILNLLEYDMELQDAVEEPRIYTNSPTSYRYEVGVPLDVRTKLNDMGHRFGNSPIDIGNVQALLIDRKAGTFTGVADSSRNGTAVGVNLKLSAQ
ncbi:MULTISPECIES: gamma-glutamyltransferase [Bacillus]|uniref:gamma-glutamyltransferase n=1 Tax=Bacillus TaxID=1386 RepID=UPI00081FB79E|nr:MULTISPECIES: gamma-glutamyltransferase [Bacillus]AOC57102.1 gamma-glutamyltransferase [Bacillus pumilus]MBR0586504.1 gamma-glutamyltransferase [Bacillus pumilus DW2J2]MBR0618740.1 gamma-glutamyltransferase [Bacillus pumilus]MBR0621362.1 gamma-glutamyltransferase [Bacillus pumilus]MBR0623039.1 gamma-glutamyltransferase [Bacillus pumilus]